MKKWRIPAEEKLLTKEQKYIRGIKEEIFEFYQKIRKNDLDKEAAKDIRYYYELLGKYWEVEEKYKK